MKDGLDLQVSRGCFIIEAAPEYQGQQGQNVNFNQWLGTLACTYFPSQLGYTARSYCKNNKKG
jgi:hypothetical protein